VKVPSEFGNVGGWCDVIGDAGSLLVTSVANPKKMFKLLRRVLRLSFAAESSLKIESK
jgi:hypothetical protein